MAEAVLDASALLAFLWLEPGSDVVAEALGRGECAMSAVNLAEVATRLVERGATGADLDRVFGPLGIEMHAFVTDSAYTAALLRPSTRQAGLSLGDRACLALAESLSVPVITCDRAWQDLSLSVPVLLARAT